MSAEDLKAWSTIDLINAREILMKKVYKDMALLINNLKTSNLIAVELWRREENKND